MGLEPNEKSLKPSEKHLDKAREKKLAKKSGSTYLDGIRERIIEVYDIEYVTKKIGELCEAEDEKAVGREGMTIRTPNWVARDKGIKTILMLHGADNKVAAQEGRASGAPSKITIVVQGGSVEKVQVKAEKEKKVEVVDIKPLPTEQSPLDEGSPAE